MNVRVVVAIDHPVGRFAARMKIERDQMAVAAQFPREVDQIALAVHDARAARQGSQIGSEVEFGRMHGDTARLQAFERIFDKIEPMPEAAEMLEGASGPTEIEPYEIVRNRVHVDVLE